MQHLLDWESCSPSFLTQICTLSLSFSLCLSVSCFSVLSFVVRTGWYCDPDTEERPGVVNGGKRIGDGDLSAQFDER